MSRLESVAVLLTGGGMIAVLWTLLLALALDGRRQWTGDRLRTLLLGEFMVVALGASLGLVPALWGRR